MMKSTDRSKFLQRMLGLAFMTAFTMSCISDEEDPPMTKPAPVAPMMDVDPTGNWNINYMFGAGCDQPASTATAIFTVTRTSDGYAVAAGAAMVSGTLICTPANCKLSGTFSWSISELQYQMNTNMVLEVHGGISGSGTESAVSATTSCDFTFTVTGSKN